MNVFFRVDASLQIGNGHIMRCLALAEYLKKQHMNCCFISSDMPGNMFDVIKKKGFEFESLQTNYHINEADSYNSSFSLKFDWMLDANQVIKIFENKNVDLLIIDHYSIDENWEKQLSGYCKSIMVIDDLANRVHQCDLLLDTTLGRNFKDYEGLVPGHCNVMCGPEYALLSSSFEKYRDYSLKRRKNLSVKKILISFGGIDKDNVTGLVIDALKLCKLPKDCKVTIVFGPKAVWLETIKKKLSDFPFDVEVAVGVDNMAQLIAESDIAIGASGHSTWERCCLGLSTLMFVIADNQKDVAEALRKKDAALIVSNVKGTSLDEICVNINKLITNHELRLKLSIESSKVCDGKGNLRVYLNLVHKKVTKTDKSISFRLVDKKDSEKIYEWQLHPSTRKYALNKMEFTWEQHENWMKKTLADPSKIFLMIKCDEVYAGTIRMDKADIEDIMDVSIYISPNMYRQGIAETAIKLLFDIFKSVKLGAKVLPNNIASNTLFEKVGFKKIKENYYLRMPDSNKIH